MNVNSWLRKAKTDIDTLDAELILLAVMGFKDRSELVLYEERELTTEQCDRADQLLLRRKTGEPLAYILGKKEFYGRDFLVSPAVLIPRPETEEVIDEIRKAPGTKIIDVGTGTGCIGITLALERPNANVTCIDISDEALAVAKQNAHRFKVKNLSFVKSDLLKAYNGERPDIIVANLPYVNRAWDWLSPELQYEPEVALYAEEQGLRLIKRLLDEIYRLWYNKGDDNYLYIYLEADPSQHPQIIDYATGLGLDYRGQKDFILELGI